MAELTVNELWGLLRAPLDRHQLDWKLQVSPKGPDGVGQVVPYADARAIQQRFDWVFGYAGWNCTMRELGTRGVVCEISVWLPGRDQPVVRSDVAGWSTDEVTPMDRLGTNDVKGAASDAFKRAAAQFGCTRYLYALPRLWIPAKELTQRGDGKWAIPRETDYWDRLPDWARDVPPQSAFPTRAGLTIEPSGDRATADDERVDEATGEIVDAHLRSIQTETPAAPVGNVARPGADSAASVTADPKAEASWDKLTGAPGSGAVNDPRLPQAVMDAPTDPWALDTNETKWARWLLTDILMTNDLAVLKGHEKKVEKHLRDPYYERLRFEWSEAQRRISADAQRRAK